MPAETAVREPVQIRPAAVTTCTHHGCSEPWVWQHPDGRRLCRRHNETRLLLLDLSIGDKEE